MRPLTFLISGGGTSGHIYPALAIAEQIKKKHADARIEFCGTARGLEGRIIPEAGYPFHAIRARGLPGRPSLEMVRAALDYRAGRSQCRDIMAGLRPHAVIGTGGYVCSPVVAAAASMGIPVLLHEQNAYPGRSNRLMARRSQAVCISFQQSADFFHAKAPLHLTGNPVRRVFFEQSYDQARAQLKISPDQPLILALGGSLGARSINQAVLGLSGFMEKWPSPQGLARPQVVLACGKQHADEVGNAASGMDWLTVHSYIDPVDQLMAAADLILCRSGAGACFELAALGRPSILVPYPHAAGDHQTANARALVDAGAALLCPDNQLNADWLARQLIELLSDSGRLLAMSRAAAGFAQPEAAALITHTLYQIMRTE